MEKGCTRYDKMCHKVFDGTANDYKARETGVKCGRCGHELESYYCESGLYMVECHCCKVKALVHAGNPKEAAFKTFGYPVLPVDDMGEECAVFFAEIPIEEPPTYVGSTIDARFPWDDVVCGMPLPCPGTNGE